MMNFYTPFVKNRCWWIFLAILLIAIPGYAQDTPPQNWHLLDYEDDGVYGISLEKGYRELLKGKTPDMVIVAVIDTGMDTLHEDLQSVLWRNIAEYGNDEDRNGFSEDIRGWNFLGGKGGKNLSSTLPEYQRQYFHLKNKYLHKKPGEIKRRNRQEYELWLGVKEKFREDSLKTVTGFKSLLDRTLKADSLIRQALNQEQYVYSDLAGLDSTDIGKYNSMEGVLKFLPEKTNGQYIAERRAALKKVMEHHTESYIDSLYATAIVKRQEIIGDDHDNFKDRYYGNGDVMDIGGHGTHVAGIIGAARNNGIGMNGISNAVKIMPVRAVPSKGDEYDKDIALAIRYAVDNGARVINMSFGKHFSPEQEWVEKAIRYAERHDVLLVNAAGNDGWNIDSIPTYPASKYLKGDKRFTNMITVGASGPVKEKLVAPFSNYGKQMVDVFAPGWDIYSAYPGGHYLHQSGTSMAAPVVSGVAAILRSYYPNLSAKQVKHIIEASVVKIKEPVMKPGDPFGKEKEWVSMNELCRTGGIVNVYKALKLAESMYYK